MHPEEVGKGGVRNVVQPIFLLLRYIVNTLVHSTDHFHTAKEVLDDVRILENLVNSVQN